jgi:alcohol dehydrogenase, propanol-preferring
VVVSAETMRAMVLETPRQPLVLETLRIPEPGPNQVLLKVQACGVCRTDLHILDGELDQPKLPLVLGHEIVGTVERVGSDACPLQVGARVGVPWLAWTDKTCRFCTRGQENLCERARFTGYTVDGGYAEYVVAYSDYCLPLPVGFDDAEAAPLLCAGLIGYRTWRLAGPDVERLGIYGFGAAAHIITQVAVQQGQDVYAFTRPGDLDGQSFARDLGASWAGGSDQRPPQALDAALIFAPVGSLVIAALEATAPGGTVVCGGIHMSDLPSFPYRLLWAERTLRSVANLTRRDGAEFFRLLARLSIRTTVQRFNPLRANAALDRLRRGDITGAAVLDWDVPASGRKRT